MCLCLVTQLCLTLCDLKDCSQAPLSMGFARQEYWTRLPFPTLGDCPDPGIELVCPKAPTRAGGFFPTVPPRKSYSACICLNYSTIES